jgi:TRAP-type C4-dicarboxylate transport system permease small subunit
MTEQAGKLARPTDPVGRALYGIAKALAIFGGVLACAMAAIVTISVTGRYLFGWPIPGDYDVVGILCGNAVFAFLPYCQLIRGNVVVDFFTTRAPDRIKSLLDAFGTLLFLVIAVIFSWRLYYGAVDFYRYSEVIAAFNFYRWTTIPFNIFCLLVLIVVIAYTFTRDVADAMAGRSSPRPLIESE